MNLDLKKLTSSIKMPSLSFLGSKDTLGIDIGSTSLKVVQVQDNRVVRWFYREFSSAEAAPEASPGDRMAVVKQILTEFLAQDKKTPRATAISVSGNSVIVRYVKLQKLTRPELMQTIQFEAEPYIP